MLESMTGSSECSIRSGKYHIKIFIKSYNHRYLETSYRSSFPVHFYEEKLDAVLREFFSRGKIDVFIEGSIMKTDADLDYDLLERYRKLIAGIPGGSGADVFRLLTLPGVLVVRQIPSPEFPVELFFDTFRRCASGLKENRLREGKETEKAIRGFIKIIKDNKKLIDKQWMHIRKVSAERIRREALEILGGARSSGTAKEPECSAAFLEWVDRQSIAEESDRLKMHIKLFTEITESRSDADDKGKRLDFLVQEMQREVNTIASKSRDALIRHCAVAIRSALENIREQLRNVC